MSRIEVPQQFTIDESLVERAKALMKDPPNKVGAQSGAWFYNGLVFRAPLRMANTQLTPKDYLREAYIAQDLAFHGVNVPLVRGLHFPESPRERFFMTLDRITGIEPQPYKVVSYPVPFREVKARFQEQYDLARSLGYTPGKDCNLLNNIFVARSGEVYLFDFGNWNAPRRITQKVESALAHKAGKKYSLSASPSATPALQSRG